jgi:hypothetical protein
VGLPCVPKVNAYIRRGFSGSSARCRYLIEHIGFQGLRFDFSKGYSGRFAGQYARAALGEDKGLVVGEYWVPLSYDDDGKQLYDQEASRQRLSSWIDETGGRCHAFDFATKGILQVRCSAYGILASPNRDADKLSLSYGVPWVVVHRLLEVFLLCTGCVLDVASRAPRSRPRTSTCTHSMPVPWNAAESSP